MEQLLVKNGLVNWTVENKIHEISFEKLQTSYIKKRHPVKGKEFTPQLEASISRIISALFGEAWLNHIDSLKNYKRLGLAQLKLKGAPLGEGKYGTVHTFKDYAIKVVAFKYYTGLPQIDGKVEAAVISELFKKLGLTGYTPNIINIYQTTRGKECDYLVLERAETNLWHFLQENACERDLKSIIFQVLFTIAIWQRFIKNFRHNDLKTDNILLFKRPRKKAITYSFDGICWSLPGNTPLVKIGDFDYASCPPKIKNPKVGTKWALNFGCSSKGSKVYDVHLFLNSIYTHRDILPQNVKKWIEKQLPLATRGSSNKVVKYSRLRNPGNWEKIINSAENLIMSPFFAEFRTNEKSYPLWGL